MDGRLASAKKRNANRDSTAHSSDKSKLYELKKSDCNNNNNGHCGSLTY